MFLCSACHRHVREPVCPFCGGDAGAALVGRGPFRIGMKRSALLLASASAVAAAVSTACGGALEPGVPDAGSALPVPREDAGSVDSASPPGNADASPDAPAPDVGAARDTGNPCDPDVMAPVTDYGIPPGPPCRDRD